MIDSVWAWSDCCCCCYCCKPTDGDDEISCSASYRTEYRTWSSSVFELQSGKRMFLL